MLNREELLAAIEPPAGEIDISEWGGKVGIRHLTAAEVMTLRDESNVPVEKREDTLDGTCRYVAKLLCDERGNRLFADTEAKLLASRGLDILLRIAEEGSRLNFRTKESREELRKNSEPGPT